MSDEKSNQDTNESNPAFKAKYNIGKIENSQVFIESTLGDITFGNIPNLASSKKDELESLKQQLIEELKNVPDEQQEEAEAVAAQMKDFVSKAEAEKPNKPLLKISGDGLIAAAENIAKIAPHVAIAARAIVGVILGI